MTACDHARPTMTWTRIASEISYSPHLLAAIKLILEDPSISNPPEKPSLHFIGAARFLRNNAPHLFQIREMGFELENRMDRWLWDFLS
jgi:hypothetical protein